MSLFDIRDLSTPITVTSGTALKGNHLAFRINTNMQSTLDPAKHIESALGVRVGNFDLYVKIPAGFCQVWGN